jgi:hypothetical protein
LSHSSPSRLQALSRAHSYLVVQLYDRERAPRLKDEQRPATEIEQFWRRQAAATTTISVDQSQIEFIALDHHISFACVQIVANDT